MGQQVANRDVTPDGNGHALRRADDALVLERRKVLRNRLRQLQLAFLVQHHHRDARNRLRHRRNAEDGVRTHRPAAPDVLVPDRMHVGHLAFSRDKRHDAAGLVPVYECLHAAMHPVQPVARDADAFRSRGRECRRWLRAQCQPEQQNKDERWRPSLHRKPPSRPWKQSGRAWESYAQHLPGPSRRHLVGRTRFSGAPEGGTNGVDRIGQEVYASTAGPSCRISCASTAASARVWLIRGGDLDEPAV